MNYQRGSQGKQSSSRAPSYDFDVFFDPLTALMEQSAAARVIAPMTSRTGLARRVLVHAATAIVTFLFCFALGVLVSPIAFSLDGIGHGKVNDGGGGFVINCYTSTYFIKLWFSSRHYRSTEKANEVFATEVASAIKVIERGPKYNRNGSLVGQRAVAILLDTEKNEQYSSVFWTDGQSLFSIDSPSMTHVLQFERHRAE